MSLTECDLRNERPERPGEFTFTWSIQNFSYCTKGEDQFLRSLDFLVEFLGDHKWYLELYPRGKDAPGFVSCYLCDRYWKEFNFTLAVCMPNGEFKESDEKVHDDSEYFSGYSKFVSLEELKGPDGYLNNDTLTVRCRMWKTGVYIPASVKWEAHSRIKVSKREYNWILNDISVTTGMFEKYFFVANFDEDSSLNFELSEEVSFGQCFMQFGLEMIGGPEKNYFWIADVHLLDAFGRVTYSARGEHLFHCSDETLLWNFPLISKEKLFANKKLYLPNNILTLRCELSFSANDEFETFLFKKTNQRDIMDKQSDLQGVWTKNMKECYKDGKFSDFIIRTPGKQFPVHRNILSAHSEVFDAMFERDMKERQTGIVDIEDLDDETVSNLLKYIYASTLDVSDCPSAQELYFAAEKYGMADLKKKCSSYLMSSLDASNVCDILVLADRHEDKDLKSYARNFFYAHAQEIMASESWKKLKENNSALAFEIMEWLFCN